MESRPQVAALTKNLAADLPAAYRLRMIRLFAALTLPSDIRDGLAHAQSGLIGARWAPSDNLHLTLSFFGALPESRAEDLDAALTSVRSVRFDLQLRGVGAFDDGGIVRTVWAGVEPSEPLNRLRAACESAARRARVVTDRRAWRPHVTLGRVAAADPRHVGAWVQANNLLRPPAFAVTAFHLYSSHRGSGGSVYRAERTYNLL